MRTILPLFPPLLFSCCLRRTVLLQLCERTEHLDSQIPRRVSTIFHRISPIGHFVQNYLSTVATDIPKRQSPILMKFGVTVVFGNVDVGNYSRELGVRDMFRRKISKISEDTVLLSIVYFFFTTNLTLCLFKQYIEKLFIISRRLFQVKVDVCILLDIYL